MGQIFFFEPQGLKFELNFQRMCQHRWNLQGLRYVEETIREGILDVTS